MGSSFLLSNKLNYVMLVPVTDWVCDYLKWTI